MSEEDRRFVAWEEIVVSREKGNRVVHYYLRDNMGNSLLAVVGRERSINHMTYALAEEFLYYYGCRSISIAGIKWNAKRDVVEWLASAVHRDQNPSALSDSQIAEPMSGITNPGMLCADKQIFLRKLKSNGSDIVWLGEASKSSKRFLQYQAMLTNGTVIAVHSFVSILAEEGNPYLGYVEELFEDKKGHKWIRIRWFYHLHEVKCMIPHVDALPREVFVSPHVQVISAGCVDGLATILTPNDYQKLAAAIPKSLLSGAFICAREFKQRKVFPYSLTLLRGYCRQDIFCSLQGTDSATADPATQGIKSIGSVSVQAAKPDPTRFKVKIKLPSQGPSGVGPKGSFKVGEYIEVLSQDSGMRGCWLKCKVIEAKQHHLKIQYLDVDDVDEPGKLEEWISASKRPAPDMLKMRCAGRPIVRPWPRKESPLCTFAVGDAVDAWWCDGWWEGVVVGYDVSRYNNFQVHFPGENKTMTFAREYLRVSRDWIRNKWVDIKRKPNICSFISSASASGSKPMLSLQRSTMATKGKDPIASKPEKQLAELRLGKVLTVDDQRDAHLKFLRKKGKSLLRPM